MIIDVTGFGWSGSGAVHDLLREYEDVHFAAFNYDWEFTLLWEPDGIYDLEYKLCHKHCRGGDSSVAIKRFLRLTEAQSKTSFLHYDVIFQGQYYEICKRYIEDLVQFTYEGATFEDIMFPNFKERIYSFYSKIIRRLLGNHIVVNLLHRDFSWNLIKQKKHTIDVSYNPANFMERTHKLMEDMFSYLGRDSNKPLVTDQMFPPDCPNLFFKYINEPIKSIVVRRDPRDTYLLAKKAYHSNIPIPVDNAEDFILFYKKTIEETKLDNSVRILNIQFEDLLYKYDETKALIEEFLGISQHKKPREFLKPEVSIQNTQLFRRYKGFEEDIRKIEEALPDSLYPFEKFPELKIANTQVF